MKLKNQGDESRFSWRTKIVFIAKCAENVEARYLNTWKRGSLLEISICLFALIGTYFLKENPYVVLSLREPNIIHFLNFPIILLDSSVPHDKYVMRGQQK